MNPQSNKHSNKTQRNEKKGNKTTTFILFINSQWQFLSHWEIKFVIDPKKPC